MKIDPKDIMTKRIYINGSVFSIDPIQNAAAYARATFSDTEAVNIWVDDGDSRRLRFSVKQPYNGNRFSTIGSITDGLIVGTDTNVEWDITVAPV